MSENDYLLAWGAYALAALGCLLAWFWFTKWMWRYLREPLRLLVAVLLFSPTIVDAARELYAPSIAITALDLLFKVGNNSLQAISDMVLYGCLAFIVYLVFVLIRWPIMRALRRRREERQATEQDRGHTSARNERLEPNL